MGGLGFEILIVVSGFEFTISGFSFTLSGFGLTASGFGCKVFGNRQECVGSHDTLRVGWLYFEGCRESRRYSRETYPESYITKFTSIRRQTPS